MLLLSRFRLRIGVFLCVVALTGVARAYVLEGGKLQGLSVNIQMKLSSTASSLGSLAPAFPLADGAPPLSWQIMGCGDINGTGTDDIVWLDTSSNTLGIWYLGPAGVLSEGVVATVPSNWRFAGLENLNGTGRSSIVWRESNVGYVGIWQIQGFSISQSYILAAAPLTWQIRPVTGQ